MKKTIKKTIDARRFCNHELPCCSVSYAGERYRVTGARKPARGYGFKFRLLDYTNQREFWTEQGPLFMWVDPPIYPQTNVNW